MRNDSFRNWKNGFETMDGGRSNGEHTPGKKTPFGKIFGIAALVLVLLILGLNSTYEIKEQEQAVLITLGKAQAVTEPGLHFKIPFIQQVRKVNTTIQGFAIGYNTEHNEVNEEESLMITSDFNFIDVDFYVEYRYSDPVKALYASQNPMDILRNISQSCIRTVIGSYPVDDVLTTGKNEIQSSIKEMILKRLADQDIGIQLVNITIQDSEPPTTEVMEAFKAVETAKQGKETALNNANKYRNEQLPSAQARADGIIKDAEAQKTERINEATAQVARFNAMYEEYIKNPVVTRQRMFYEAMENVLPDLKVIIESSDGNMQTIYPLESFTGSNDDDTSQPAQTTGNAADDTQNP
ncbi:FtsH protease activity modulator HflK [Acetatifactor muris]|uniref:Protein HflK n=1 Tax=Acetatifactor muris TaxID=879566 RepID=A0A2K4ZE24_9FIRM|nr:FtsH protease activity modulator HflK [Acetatifactor muris]MCR2047117.1 FtsH protease activity modulator HflK [Acetatifactor muris]SOY28725.1 Modulator of FtsH protease HflK [Acetatifactor muris]